MATTITSSEPEVRRTGYVILLLRKRYSLFGNYGIFVTMKLRPRSNTMVDYRQRVLAKKEALGFLSSRDNRSQRKTLLRR